MSGTAAGTMDIEEGAAHRADPLLRGQAKRQQRGTSGMTASAAIAVATASGVPSLSAKEGLAMSKSRRRMTRIVIIIAIIAMVFALLSMWAEEGSAIAIIAFIFPLILSPYVIYQRKLLNKLPTLTYVINQTRQQVNRLSEQNNLFTAENDRLTVEVGDLKEVDHKFHVICQSNGTNVNEMKKLIQENGELQKQMKKILNAQQLQDIFASIVVSDTNQDFKLTEEELDRCMLRLKGYNVADRERLKDTLRLWASKADLAEFKELEKDSDAWL